MPQHAASDQDLHYLLTDISIKDKLKLEKVHQTPLKRSIDKGGRVQ